MRTICEFWLQKSVRERTAMAFPREETQIVSTAGRACATEAGSKPAANFRNTRLLTSRISQSSFTIAFLIMSRTCMHLPFSAKIAKTGPRRLPSCLSPPSPGRPRGTSGTSFSMLIKSTYQQMKIIHCFEQYELRH